MSFEGTRIFGSSDDRIETEGEYISEGTFYGSDDQEHGILLICSDLTLLEIKYGKGDMAIWGIKVLHQGSLFDHIEFCDNEDADPYSDIIFLKKGIKWIYMATDWYKMD